MVDSLQDEMENNTIWRTQTDYIYLFTLRRETYNQTMRYKWAAIHMQQEARREFTTDKRS